VAIELGLFIFREDLNSNSKLDQVTL
jgi:hypothetical protein